MLGAALVACGARAERRGATVLYASGADLQTINPLFTIHPLAKQVQKFLLLTTLARYDSALRPVPYLASGWDWSLDRRTLTLRLRRDVPWHDGTPTTAHDAAWTLEAARDPLLRSRGIPDPARLLRLADRRPRALRAHRWRHVRLRGARVVIAAATPPLPRRRGWPGPCDR